MQSEQTKKNPRQNGIEPTCTRCGAAAAHEACPLCSGRGCISPRELAERLGYRELLSAAELTADAVAKALDGRVLECFEAARKIERERAESALAAERERSVQAQRQQREQMRAQADEMAQLRQEHAAAEARAKQAEEALSRRRQQPAAMGRGAERDFAAVVGSQVDMRISPKLPKSGDYEVYVKVDLGTGAMVELSEPILVDVKRESSALQTLALTRLVRDCKSRGRSIGALVAYRTEEVGEIFGSPRVRMIDGTTIVLTAIDAFANDVRLLGPYFKTMLDARLTGDGPLLAELGAGLTEIATLVADLEKQSQSVAGVLEKQADALRTSVGATLCRRVLEVIHDAHRRIADAAGPPNGSGSPADAA